MGKEPSDAEWIRKRRQEEEHRSWLLGRLRSVGGWLVGAFTALWAGIDAVFKFIDWMKK